MIQSGLRGVVVSFLVLISLGIPQHGATQCHEEHDDRALAADPAAATMPIAPKLSGMGDHHHAVTTSSAEAQVFFNQGLQLNYAFNHAEALRAFKEAARLDPECAMAYWGWALVLGPNLNLPMQPHVAPQAYSAMQKAVALRDKVTPRERAYVDALAVRYLPEAPTDRSALDLAYAEAMAKVHEQYPEDTDAATLYADALMNLSPWNYWTPDGQPRERTPAILEALEGAIARDAAHEGALHLYIHAVEAVDAARAEPAADRLRGLAPNAGHLVHMPSHIYMQVGRYAESYEANLLASGSDAAYIAHCRAQGIYPLGYFPHNLHFLAWAATYQGRSAAAIEASRKAAAVVPDDVSLDQWGLFQSFASMPLYSLVRFGRWAEILSEPEPREDLPYTRGIHRFARGMALANTGPVKQAERELAEVRRMAAADGAKERPVGFTNVHHLLTLASEMLAGEIEAKRGRHDQAIAHLDRALRMEDGLPYNEPPDWYLPVRHRLGAVLIEAGRPAEAEVLYWQDLRKRRENGFALLGMAQSLRAQGRADSAEEFESRYHAAWADADGALTTSRF